MELILNSFWALLSVAGICLWLRFGRRETTQQRLSFLALLMLIAVAFPVISVSDDLWSMQNPAETDTCQRRDHHSVCPHHITPVTPAPPEPVFAGLSLHVRFLSVTRVRPAMAVANPALESIQNRPPPAA